MDIALHLGAHRCATTSFQSFLWDNRCSLARAGLTVWTPRRTRDGLLRGMLRHPPLISVTDEENALRSVGRMRMQLDLLDAEGQQALLISEENILGSMANNLQEARLYPLVQERLLRFRPAFDGRPLRVALSIRSYEDYWASALSHLMLRGWSRPSVDMMDLLTTQPRRWRTLVREIHAVWPEAKIIVQPFERAVGDPRTLLRKLWQGAIPQMGQGEIWKNRRPDLPSLNRILMLRGERPLTEGPVEIGARWMPFDEDQCCVLRAEYRRDIAWLEAGAEGLAHYEGRKESGGPTIAPPHHNFATPTGHKSPAARPDRGMDSHAGPDRPASIGGQEDGIETRMV